MAQQQKNKTKNSAVKRPNKDTAKKVVKSAAKSSTKNATKKDSTNEEYYPRLVDEILQEKLKQTGAVVIKGPKWCGKTMTALEHSKSVLFMQDPDTLKNNLTLAEEKPSLLLEGKKPRLIDEWQEAPVLWDAVRFSIDSQKLIGAYILTGSATPKTQPRHSGAGRMSFIEMRTMSLFESKETNAAISLSSLFSDKPIIKETNSNTDIELIAQLLVRGGWPAEVTHKAKNVAEDYLYALINFDVHSCDDIKRSPLTAREVLQEYARTTSTQAGIASMSRNLKERGGEVSRPTFIDYIAAYKKLNIIEDVPAWRPSLKSKARSTSTPKRFLTDPSLVCAAMNIKPEMLLKDMSTMGHVFENLCVRDLKIYCSTFGANLFFYHDSTGLETDCVIVDPQGKWGLIEIKLPAAEIEAGVAALNKVEEKIYKTQIGDPSFKMVITGSGYSRVRPDGIIVCPITCLAP